ncbi:bifunctional diaminohydroxyphosphoribosylaminopyrimidine deaminase/5-amino-6-(5-phosphoribosylamino)uracil reductase RibD [Aurantiacibacter sp. D1-12]|uniref:bifunctional diaminohydroxyphosphoribosylaminopyrimidine deaminase/5-amino-6-(5-phosphoribosylamino)uracil reductase RibD n=1 Tax=Aurantiacibacter sp. D1-12 TaxID=2993658 RepID=UPI00237CEC2D|nr:bifunctional diaminohydroxyphosphoribosylaminopyrimidine deaminase/5-amino-6-(5-phosphoribosylamino)uracil reductase RibD [Aurantiacibacter sp. D1-12]MDE1467615.1 bifunctional diaminohydroxyphosphoribosylaminopyrimidine deaminase/5-amino-6-(5-phosphoribosylamino)uracil reductase RibD [Aurantiacibacter sp. D1-12]
MLPKADDARWLAAAVALAERARPGSNPNPGVGAIIVRDGIVVGRGWTQPGGRPHAEAAALKQAGEAARGATLYVTLEPCAHQSERGPACADLVGEAGLARAVVGLRDPDARTAGKGITRLAAAGIEVVEAGQPADEFGLAGHEAALTLGRPHVTLKLALSLDGCIATATGESQWITGEAARAHTHRERARADAILVGGGTVRADGPQLTVRLDGLEARSPQRIVLTRGEAPEGWQAISAPESISALADIRYLFIEGGAQTATAFLEADLVDRLLIYRAPILLGGKPGIAPLALPDLASAHGRWRCEDTRQLGQDTLEIYTRTR